MAKTFHHIFFLKKERDCEKGPVPIYLRITVDGKRAEISIGKKVQKDLWIPKIGRANGNAKAIQALNSHLMLLEYQLFEAFQAMLSEKRVITAIALKNKCKGIDDYQRMLVPIFQKHNSRIAALVPKEYSPGTVERYKTSLSHTIEFIKWKYKASDINIQDINHDFISDYDFYLRSVRKCSNNTTVKYLKNFRKIIRICIVNGWIDKDPFAMYEGKLKEIEKVYLFEEEIRVIFEKNFETNRLNQVRDTFIFCCFTGLAYADVKKIAPQNLVTGMDGKKWLFVNRTKTGTSSHVPLLPTALSILNKYEHDLCFKERGKLLPVLSNQKMNAYLKEIADSSGIKKDLTFHTARHTFATTVTLNNHVSIESVSKMLGHKRISATQHYAKILDLKISQDMQALYSKF